MAHSAMTRIPGDCASGHDYADPSDPECFLDAQDTLFFHRLFRVQEDDTGQQLTDSRNAGLNKSLNASSSSCNRSGEDCRAIAPSY